MKITKQQLKQIIKEEVENILQEYDTEMSCQMKGGTWHADQQKCTYSDEFKSGLPESQSEVINENLTDDEGAAINQGDILQIVDSDAGYLVLNLGNVPKYNLDHGGDRSEYDTRMLVQVLNIRDPRT